MINKQHNAKVSMGKNPQKFRNSIKMRKFKGQRKNEEGWLLIIPLMIMSLILLGISILILIVGQRSIGTADANILFVVGIIFYISLEGIFNVIKSIYKKIKGKR